MTSMTELGEKSFLKALLPALRVDSSFINGFGHDASIVDVGLDQYLAMKIDRAPFPVALHRGIGDYRTWGRLAVAANVSDLLAVGAKPRALMLSLVVPGGFMEADARAIVMGCEEACLSHGVAFVGGDTKEGDTAQVIGAAWGTVEKGAIFGRAPATPGDYLVLAGRLGAFAGTLALMDANLPASEFSQEWVSTLTFPAARVREGQYLRESRKVAAACDLSDGLAEALQIFCSTGSGIALSEARLPMHELATQASRVSKAPLWRFALGVGDWAIACVVREKDMAQFHSTAAPALELFVVGQFDDTGHQRIVDTNGVVHEIPKLINEQFRLRIEDRGSYMHDLLRAP